MILNKIRKFFLDLFFPKKCLGCGKHDIYLCAECFRKIEIVENHTCFFCNKITGNGRVCLNCQTQNHLDRIISATNYANPLIRNLIKALKYGLAQELAKPSSELIIKTLVVSDFGFRASDFTVIPIPLYTHRLRNRGFNQAELIAREIADYFHLPIKIDILKRIRATERQSELKNDEERKNNIKDAFEINNLESIKNKIILLVDDVITSGATLSAAAKILKQNNAKEVWAITVAKG